MSCSNNSCGNANCAGDCSSTSANNCVSQLSLSIAPNSCTLCGSLNGIPIVPVDLGPAIKHCETDTRLRLDTDNCALRYEGESFPETGVADVISICSMLNCAAIGCLGDVSATPASQCDLLSWDDTNHEWIPYTIPDGTINDLVGVTDEGCLVKSSDISCTIGQQLSAATIDNFVGVDSNGCLAINNGGSALGSCQIGPTVGIANHVIGIAAMPASSFNDYGVLIQIPARTCPVFVFIWAAGYTNILPHVNGGQPFHLVWYLGLNNPAAYFTEVNMWHDTGTVNGSWSSGSMTAYPSILALPAGGPDDIYMRYLNDANPAVAPTIDNISSEIFVKFMMVAQ